MKYAHGKFTQSRNKQADAKATTVLALVHADLCGKIEPEDKDGYRYAIAFTDDCSGMIYFIKAKGDTPKATGKIHSLCSSIWPSKMYKIR